MLSLSSNAVQFNCYPRTDYPVQAIALGNLNCEKGGKKKAKLIKDGATGVMCLYMSYCEALEQGELPTVLKPDELQELQTNPAKQATSVFKNSFVSCDGTGFMVNGNLLAHCEDTNPCQVSALYGAVLAPNSGQAKPHVIIDAPEVKGAQER